MSISLERNGLKLDAGLHSIFSSHLELCKLVLSCIDIRLILIAFKLESD